MKGRYREFREEQKYNFAGIPYPERSLEPAAMVPPEERQRRMEEGWTQGDIPRRIVAHYLEAIRRMDVDTLVMGCTHYEYFRPLLQEELGDQVTLINTPDIVARELKNILSLRGELVVSEGAGYVRIYSTDISEALDRVVSELFQAQKFPNQVTIQSAQIPPQFHDDSRKKWES